jgi:group I intron endonuclease
VYIGYTSKTIDERFKIHCENARWKRNYALADAIRVYGVPAFTVDLLLQCESHKEACEHEICFIKELNSILPHGYNMTHGGDGVPMTPEVIAKMSASKRGKITPKMLASFARRKGKKLSEKHKQKLSAIGKGRRKSEEWKLKISLSNLGKKRSLKTCAKISASKKGKPWSEAAWASFELRKRNKNLEAA